MKVLFALACLLLLCTPALGKLNTVEPLAIRNDGADDKLCGLCLELMNEAIEELVNIIASK